MSKNSISVGCHLMAVLRFAIYYICFVKIYFIINISLQRYENKMILPNNVAYFVLFLINKANLLLILYRMIDICK